jgi:SepF-like predicted cell division protein (DUF552 family)
MADKKNAMTDREKDIARDIRGVCSSICPDLDLVNDHKDAVDAIQGEKGSLVTSKLQIMAQIAEMSSVGKWLPGEIKNAVAYAATTMSNAEPGDRTAKSLATFLSEMKSVADPKVRDRFPTLLSCVETAWEAEEADKKAELATPIRKWSSRKYHAVVNVLRAVKDGKVTITQPSDVVAYAEENDPDHNAERVAKRLEALAKTLHGIFVDFGNEDIYRAQQYVASITVEDLLTSRKVKLAEKAKAEREHKLANTPVPKPAPAPKSAPTPTPATTTAQTVEPAEGAFDLAAELDNVMNDEETTKIMELAA